MGQFASFMTNMMEQYGEKGQQVNSEKPATEDRIYTPVTKGSNIPEIKAERPTYRPEITKGKLYFNCPACFYPTAVFAKYTGKKTRCPRCFSAIRTPDPVTGVEGQNLENDIETLLHPEEFVPMIPRRTTFQTLIPFPQINTALSTAAMVVFFAASIGAGHLAIKYYSPNTTVTVKENPNASSFSTKNLSIELLQARAETLVERFLNEPDWYSRSRLVRDRERVAPLMKDYYRTFRPNDIPGQHDRHISAVRTGFYKHLQSDTQYTVVSAQTAGSHEPPIEFIVEHTTNGDTIEWESSVA